MTGFAHELSALLQAQAQAHPTSTEGSYAMPWYLVMGTPGTGRTTAIKALNMSWPRGDGPLPGDTLCRYWMPEKAAFIEPTARVVGPQRQHGLIEELCKELRKRRPREPIDGIVLVVSAALLADSTEDGVDDYAKGLRRELIEVNQALGADVPIYVVVTHYDSLWGFGDAFRWTAERRDEGGWGFSLPLDLKTADTPKQVKLEMEGLCARVESMCFARLSAEDPPDMRLRSFQHLTEARDMLDKLAAFLHIVTHDNAFERAPWVRALAIGSGVPGTGHRLRHNAQQFLGMGIQQPSHSGTPTPGGMPLHGLLDAVLIPERDLVPTRVRWRDDWLLVIFFVLGALAWIALIALIVRPYVGY